jgi:hypothetical protein
MRAQAARRLKPGAAIHGPGTKTLQAMDRGYHELSREVT